MANRKISLCLSLDCPGRRVCKVCKNLYAQNWRLAKKEISPDPDVKKKDRARKIVMLRLRKGQLEKKPCEICKSENVLAHHEDYNHPTKIRWLCRFHHNFICALLKQEPGPLILDGFPTFQNPHHPG